MAIAPSFLEELRARLPLSSVVGRRVRLARKGREFEGLCPFHNEKSPSFFVNDEKAFYHCFGCGAHGDVIGFVIQMEGLSFPDAVQQLAAQAGMEVPQSQRIDPVERDHLADLRRAMEAACVYFQGELAKPSGRMAMEYITRRGLGQQDIARFRLGWAPDARNGLKAYLANAGVSNADAIEAGLLIQADDKPDSFDRFRGRVMFPISDKRGQVIAFGGRIMGDGQPKYLNSPETPLFHKGRVLFAHHLAREAAVKTSSVIVTEGYMDVVALHRAGFVNAVAPLGTALTEEQLGELWRLAPEPLLCFDGDSAGQRAAERAALRAWPLLEPGKSLRFVVLPPGQDPDDVVRAPGGVALFRKLVSEAQPLVERIWQIEIATPHDTPERRADLKRRLRERLGEIKDRDVRDAYAAEFAERQRALFGGRPSQPATTLNQRSRNRSKWSDPPETHIKLKPRSLDAKTVNGHSHALALLATFLNHPTLIGDFFEQLAEVTFDEERLDSLRSEIVNQGARAPGLDSAALYAYLADCGYTPEMTQILHREVYRNFPFAQSGADLDRARESCLSMFRLIGTRNLPAERLAAEHQAVEEQTAEGWARFQAAFGDAKDFKDETDD